MIDIKNNSIILFDGLCNLCNSSVQFIIKRDKKLNFYYVSLQSDAAHKLLLQFHQKKIKPDSIILIENGKIYQKSTAALRISKKLSGLWKVLYGLIIVPKPVRDFVYDIIADNRYKWFGKRNKCMIPTEEQKDLFLE